MTTLEDVARRAGVSAKTVSRVLNNEPNVRSETRDHVLGVAKDMGYRPNPAARSLAGARSFLIAHLYDNPNADYVARANRGVYEASRRHGYYLLPEPVDSRGADLIARIETFLETSRVDGVILTPPLSDDADIAALLTHRGVRHVLVSPERRTAGQSSVWMDEAEAGAVITRRLLELGHRRIGFIAGPPQHGAASDRRRGYEDALRDAGLAAEPDLIRGGDFSLRSGLEQGEALLALEQRPTAVFAANDDMAAGVMTAALKSGLAIPEDLSVAGVDASQIGAALWPPLTTIRQPIGEMTRRAADWLMSYPRDGDAEPLEERFDFELVERGSTGPAR